MVIVRVSLSRWLFAHDLTISVLGAVHGTEAASWLSVCTLPLCVFLLVSYAVLHPKWTHRHYLSVCFTLGICCMQVRFSCWIGSLALANMTFNSSHLLSLWDQNRMNVTTRLHRKACMMIYHVLSPGLFFFSGVGWWSYGVCWQINVPYFFSSHWLG